MTVEDFYEVVEDMSRLYLVGKEGPFTFYIERINAFQIDIFYEGAYMKTLQEKTLEDALESINNFLLTFEE